jgi:hypothetical protein
MERRTTPEIMLAKATIFAAGRIMPRSSTEKTVVTAG